MDSNRFSSEELSVLRSLFEASDFERNGLISVNQLPNILVKLGKSDDEIVNITKSSTKIAEETGGRLTFEDLIAVLEQSDNASAENTIPFEGPDPKVLEFCRILEEYRVKCEEEGNYLEAARSLKQLGVLKKQEEKRQQKAIRARQISERQDVQLAHNMQFGDFNSSWDKYMEEYDSMAQVYIQQMTEGHAVKLLDFQKNLRGELADRPPKWSKELLEWRRRQHMLARRKAYGEAQKIKKIADQAEEKEKMELEQEQAIIFARREAKFRQQQQSELQALLKRIEVRRKEHIKQRNVDSKRLLQRNRNVQAVLESKQSVESHRLNQEIKKNLTLSATASSLASSKAGINTRTKDRDLDRESEDLLGYSDDPPFMRAAGPDLLMASSGKDD